MLALSFETNQYLMFPIVKRLLLENAVVVMVVVHAVVVAAAAVATVETIFDYFLMNVVNVAANVVNLHHRVSLIVQTMNAQTQLQNYSHRFKY